MTSPEKQTVNKKAKTGCCGLLVILAVVIFFAVTCSRSGADKNNKHSLMEAFIMSQDFVKQRLKAPASAQFATNCDEGSNQLNDSSFFIVGHVDSQNSFGALLRSNYTCRITFTDEDHARCEDLDLNENN